MNSLTHSFIHSKLIVKVLPWVDLVLAGVSELNETVPASGNSRVRLSPGCIVRLPARPLGDTRFEQTLPRKIWVGHVWGAATQARGWGAGGGTGAEREDEGSERVPELSTSIQRDSQLFDCCAENAVKGWA